LQRLNTSINSYENIKLIGQAYFISTDLDEILSLSDLVHVLYQGRLQDPFHQQRIEKN
jgi:ABC-type uncharacterized transport system ATPase subunit